MYGRNSSNIFSRSNNTSTNSNSSANIFNRNNNSSYGNNGYNNSSYSNNYNTGYGNNINYSKLGSGRVSNYNPNNAPRCLQDINPKWKSSQLNPTSIISRPQTMHLSVTELRLEDYYLIRTNRLGKDEERLVRDAIDKKHFSSDLMNSHVVANLKEPITFQEVEINLDTLKQLNRNRNIWGSGTGSTSNNYGNNNSSYGNNNNNNNNSYGNNNSRNIFSSNNNSSSSNIFNRGNNNNSSSNIFSNNNSNSNSNNNGGNIFSNNNNNRSNIFGNNNNSGGNSNGNIFSNNNSSSNNIFNRNNNSNSGGNSNNNNSSNNIFNRNNNNSNNIFSNNNGNNNNSNNIFSNNNNKGNNIFNNNNNNNNSSNNSGRNIFSNNNNNNNGYNNNGGNVPSITEYTLTKMMQAQTILLQSLVDQQNKAKANLTNNNGSYSLFDSSYNPYIDNNTNMLKTNPYATRFDDNNHNTKSKLQPLYSNYNNTQNGSYYDIYDYETAQMSKSRKPKPYTIHHIPKKSQVITQFFNDKYGKDKPLYPNYYDHNSPYQYGQMAENNIEMRSSNMRMRETGMRMRESNRDRQMEEKHDEKLVSENSFSNNNYRNGDQYRFANTNSYYVSQAPQQSYNNKNQQQNNVFYMLVLNFAEQGSHSVVQRFEKSTTPQQKPLSLLEHVSQIQRWYNSQSQDKFRKFYHIQRIDITSIDSHQVKANVILTKVNLPEGYYFKPRTFDGFEVNNFEITNQYGTVRWVGKVDVAGIDFSHGFTIKPNQIDCSINQLNKQCIATFNTLPQEIVKLDPTVAKQMLQNYFKHSSQGKITLESFSNNPPEYRIRIKNFPEKIVAN